MEHPPNPVSRRNATECQKLSAREAPTPGDIMSECLGRLRRNPQLKGKSVMRTLLASAGLALLMSLATEPSVSAQEAPEWMKQTLPDQVLKPHVDEYLAVMNPTGALDGKTKQLIGLGVAAQIPCAYCVYAHTKAAKAAGATDAQIKEEWLGRRQRVAFTLNTASSPPGVAVAIIAAVNGLLSALPPKRRSGGSMARPCA